MSKITTADCKDFIVDFVTKNPSVITSIYGPTLPTVERDSLINEAKIAKNWKRETKFKVDPNDDEDFEIHNINVPVRRCQYDGTTTVDARQFTIGREFCLCPNKYEDGIKFIILEKLDESLVFGPYSGD
jgi:hypothetical protein